MSRYFCDECLRYFLTDSEKGIEHWVRHPKYTNYFVSNLARVSGPEKRVLKPFPSDCGYPTVKINYRNKRVHHLILESPMPDNFEACNKTSPTTTT